MYRAVATPTETDVVSWFTESSAGTTKSKNPKGRDRRDYKRIVINLTKTREEFVLKHTRMEGTGGTNRGLEHREEEDNRIIDDANNKNKDMLKLWGIRM